LEAAVVPRSQVYGRSALPHKGKQQAPAQRHSNGHHSPSNTGLLSAANPSQLACFHQGKKKKGAVKVEAEFSQYRPNPLLGFGQPPRPFLHTTN